MTVARFFGVLLIAGGALIMVLCGLCTLVIIGASLVETGPRDAGLSGIPLVLLIGGVPTAFGALMIWGGIVLVRAKPSSQSQVDPQTFD